MKPCRCRCHRRGEAVNTAKLTARDVLEIRRARANGTTYPSLAAQFGLSITHVGRIVRRENWRHI